MVKRYTALGYDAFLNLIRDLEKAGDPVFLLFIASKGPTGKSWSSECEKAEALISEAISFAPKESNLVCVQVGNKSTWEDRACLFRTDPVLALKSVPTLTLWGSSIKLQDKKCIEVETLKIFFETSVSDLRN